jgi:hypothetical protein
MNLDARRANPDNSSLLEITGSFSSISASTSISSSVPSPLSSSLGINKVIS